jgi:hypothetical protein
MSGAATMPPTKLELPTDFDVSGDALRVFDWLPRQLDELITELAAKFALEDQSFSRATTPRPLVRLEHARRAARVLEDALKLYVESHPEHADVIQPFLNQLETYLASASEPACTPQE